MTSGDHGLLRARGDAEKSRVTFVELFFDLRLRIRRHTALAFPAGAPHLAGVVQTTLLLMAMWWVWIDTSWVTNWLDPEKTPVRLMLFVLMLVGLVLSTSIPQGIRAEGAGLRLGLCVHAGGALPVSCCGR